MQEKEGELLTLDSKTPALSAQDRRIFLAGDLDDDAYIDTKRVLSKEGLDRLGLIDEAAHAIMYKYTAAMKEMEIRLEILDQNLKQRNKRSTIHHIESRLKSPRSIIEKLDRYGKEPTIENAQNHILDIAGVRVICSISRVFLYETLDKQDEPIVDTVKDYIAEPKTNGYRSLHLIAHISVNFLDGKEEIPVEIQLRTIAMDFWASLEHDLKYKALREIPGIDSVNELKECSRIIEDVEGRMQVLARALESE